MIKVAVIGSGPSGVACAYSLLKQKGVKVDMLDTGFNIEPDIAHLENNKELICPKTILKQVKASKRQLLTTYNKLPDKLAFGSDYVYKECDKTKLTQDVSTHFSTSQAKGGLGNVWGANINALADIDIQDWPISAADLSPYFKLLEEFTPIAAEHSILDHNYDYKLTGKYDFKPSKQAAYVLDNIARNNEHLTQANINIARARLAVGKVLSSNQDGCVSCGLCMHGCPYNAIFNPKFVVDKFLINNRDFNYIPHTLVEKITEIGRAVNLSIKDLQLNTNKTVKYDRIYVACGSVGSTVLIARSLNWTNKEFTFLDSQKYLFPFFLSKRIVGAVGEATNTLAQICAQTNNLASSNKTLHMQLYGYNDLLVEPLRLRLGEFITNKLVSMGSPLLERIMIGMVYLHSDDSGYLKFKVQPDVEKGWGNISGVVNPKSKMVYKEFITKLNELKASTGGSVFSSLTMSNLPGNSQHFGGSLPMKANSGLYETDHIGRPYGMEFTHVVDTSVFTSIPGTPTTYPAMANAARIAIESLKLIKK